MKTLRIISEVNRNSLEGSLEQFVCIELWYLIEDLLPNGFDADTAASELYEVVK